VDEQADRRLIANDPRLSVLVKYQDRGIEADHWRDAG
jgi:hypothetical protein